MALSNHREANRVGLQKFAKVAIGKDGVKVDDGSKPVASEMNFWRCRLESNLGLVERDGSSALLLCKGCNLEERNCSPYNCARPVLKATP